MKLILNPPHDLYRTKCLLLVGGSGDTAERFQTLVDLMAPRLPEYTICTFSLSQMTASGTSLLDTQATELTEVMSQLLKMNQFIEFSLFATSMGSYPTVKILLNPDYSHVIKHVIFFDPADYYLSDQFNDPNDEVTWSGYEKYNPVKPVISTELFTYTGSAMMDVVHLTVRNHGPNGYLHTDYSKRETSVDGGYPRLNTEMVKKFHDNTPLANRGKYQEIDNLPHGFFRDGNIKVNLQTIAKIIAKLLGY